MEPPLLADELCQFIHCCRWMSEAIHAFTKRSSSLVKTLVKTYTKCWKKKETDHQNNKAKGLMMEHRTL